MSSTTVPEQQQIFAALADPIRRSLLEHLAEGTPKTATQLTREYPITRQGILKHLVVLEAAGLVATQQVGRDKRYTLRPAPLNELEQWVKELGARWEARLLRLKTLLEEEG